MQWPHIYHKTILYIREMGSAGYYFRGVNTYRALPKIRDLGRSEHYFGDQNSTDDPPPPPTSGGSILLHNKNSRSFTRYTPPAVSEHCVLEQDT